MTWVQVELMGSNEIGRCSHCAEVVDTKLLIFGGYQS